MRLSLSLFAVTTLLVSGALTDDNRIILHPDLELREISENVYIHTSYMTLERYGRFPCNGLIYIKDGKSAIIDTPVSDELSERLITWLNDSLNVAVDMVIGSHWHNDCIGGLGAFFKLGIPSYGLQLTRQIAIERGIKSPQTALVENDTLSLGRSDIVCMYPGPGHAVDNIVVWLPSEGILFGGCLVKSGNSRGLGNTADADVRLWDDSLRKVKSTFSTAWIVVPGHGEAGAIELIDHTIGLVENAD